MDKQLKKIYLYMGLLIGIIFIGVAYAYFTAGLSSETSTTIRADAGTMNIVYNGGTNINLSGIYPRDEVWATKNITVTGNNTTDAEMYYKLTLVVDSNTFKTDDPLEYELVSTNTSTNGEIIPAISKTNITSSSIELGKGHFLKANNAVHTYQLKIYYPKKATSQNDNQGAAFSAHVEITSVKASTSGENTLADIILASNEVKTPLTIPGKEESIESEAILASAEDDYGTSYYFRGAVKNNYVQFANKCWRVVRINGDKSVKLVLHNDNTPNESNPCAAANNNDYGAFAHYDGNTYTSAFNETSDDNAYIGFMYGTADSSDYASTHANTNKSTILTNLETWYTNNLASYESKLADTIWCNDKTNVTDTTYDPWSFGNITGLGYAKNATYYSATQRLISASNTAGGTGPSLKCPNDNNGGKLSKFTVDDTTNGNGNLTYKIGILTADEAAFAGYSYVMNYVNATYLHENASYASWWTLSPSNAFNNFGTYVWYVNGLHDESGPLKYRTVDSYGVAVRPSISLKASTNATGDGTSENPYIVK